VRAPLLAVAGTLVAIALGLSHGNLDPRALALVLAAIALAALALWRREDAPGGEHLAALALGAGIAAGLLHDLLRQPGWHATHAAMPAFRPLLAVAAGLAATHLWRGAPPAVARLRPPALALSWVVLVALVFRAYPSPAIDVWTLQQGAAGGLLRGENPYLLTTPNPYGPGTALLAPELLTPDGAAIRGFPYPPLTVLAGVPAYALLGDVRWAHAALTLLAAAGIWLLGRRTRVAELAATLVLFQPSAFFLVEQAWTEPLVLASLTGLALAVSRAPGAVWPGVAAGLAIASKQYAPLLAVPFLAAVPRRAWPRAVAIALAVPLALALPFVAWDAAALWHGLVEFQLVQPFRRDSLSVAAALFAWNGTRLPAWPGFVAAGLTVALAWRRAQRVDGALAAAVLAWLVFLAPAKQAFANYYGLAVGLLCAAVAAASATAPRQNP